MPSGNREQQHGAEGFGRAQTSQVHGSLGSRSLTSGKACQAKTVIRAQGLESGPSHLEISARDQRGSMSGTVLTR